MYLIHTCALNLCYLNSISALKCSYQTFGPCSALSLSWFNVPIWCYHLRIATKCSGMREWYLIYSIVFVVVFMVVVITTVNTGCIEVFLLLCKRLLDRTHESHSKLPSLWIWFKPRIRIFLICYFRMKIIYINIIILQMKIA